MGIPEGADLFLECCCIIALEQLEDEIIDAFVNGRIHGWPASPGNALTRKIGPSGTHLSGQISFRCTPKVLVHIKHKRKLTVRQRREGEGDSVRKRK